MKGLIILLAILILILSGCASVTMTKSGEDITWKSATMFKDIQDVTAGSGDDGFDFNMGSSVGGITAEQAQAVACLRNPAACK